ncbi:FtsX-like permease family protein [Roseimaritima multifibrata]|uniref:FtsX-like permease family protein n=1 Tax=Roseimaritima multifibrata TaxID=1930274 RepID=A0A517MCE1_9BACT|nr:FtsX-like permease family protein [Roseimaritima multifibrata]QDS92541.1 FtsX-like permease family protein [Roseimaritima multifibrata]
MNKPAVTPNQIAFRSLLFHWRISFAIAMGVAVATAVITGALLVGDSMRGSLRGLTEQRLGHVAYTLFPGGFFSPADWLAEETDVTPVGIVYFPRGVVEFSPDQDATGSVRRAGGVQVIATDADFWDLDTSGVRPKQMPDEQSVVLNQAAAIELGVQIGDEVTVRLPKEQAVPADSPLGNNAAESEGLPRMKVVDIVPTVGLGRFSLTASQVEPQNVYLSRELVADVLAREGQVNGLLIGATNSPRDLAAATDVAKRLQEDLHPTLADFGLQLEQVQQEFDGEPVIDYFSLSSDRLLISDSIRAIVSDHLGAENVHPVMTYLANRIEKIEPDGQLTGLVPYSTLTGIDSLPDLPLDFNIPDSAAAVPPAVESASGTPAAWTVEGLNLDSPAVPIVLNDWAADRLKAKPGDSVLVSYFEPETQQSREVKRQFRGIVASIVPIATPAKPFRRKRPAIYDVRPTVYNDPLLTPTVPGVTDQESISAWNVPFELEDTVEKEDDEYWNNYRLTPKAFLPLSDAERLFGSRFGQTTSLRIDRSVAVDREALVASLDSALRTHQADLGFVVQPIRATQLIASKGTTPFDVLFLSLSMFVIFAALLLIALLVRLGLLGRAKEYGTLLAGGWTSKSAAGLVTREGLLAAVPGAICGVVLGGAYAWGVLWALRTLWVGAVTVPFLQFHWSWLSLLGGMLAGIVMAGVTIRWTARQLGKTPPRILLAGQFGESTQPGIGGASSWLKPLAGGLVLVSLVLGGVASQLSGQGQAGAFVAAGMLLLIGLLMWIHAWLQIPAAARRSRLGATDSLWKLAVGNARRNPLRSTLTIGLMASACFLILSMSAFQLAPTDRGVGGFDLIGQTAQPFYRDLNATEVRAEMFGDRSSLLDDSVLVAARMRLGQDASCNNLYQAAQPTVLGFPDRLAALYEKNELTPFAWGATAPVDGTKSPWRNLAQAATGTADDPVPMVLDQNTAMWALQMYGGVGGERGFVFDDGKERYFKVVGLLTNSMLQGVVIIGEGNFKTLFPEISGNQYFLVQTPAEKREAVAELLEDRLGDVGMDVTDTRVRLSQLLAVQNTYLRTFQSLGALGLLLGSIGLAIAQLRSVLERRGELAVMRALGFTRQRISRCVLLEHAALLIAGIGCGSVAALLAVIPYALIGRAQVPIVEPLLWIASVMIVGMLAGVFVLSRVSRMPLVAALRSQ